MRWGWSTSVASCLAKRNTTSNLVMLHGKLHVLNRALSDAVGRHRMLATTRRHHTLHGVSKKLRLGSARLWWCALRVIYLGAWTGARAGSHVDRRSGRNGVGGLCL